jgi:hypothetical protein
MSKKDLIKGNLGIAKITLNLVNIEHSPDINFAISSPFN